MPLNNEQKQQCIDFFSDKINIEDTKCIAYNDTNFIYRDSSLYMLGYGTFLDHETINLNFLAIQELANECLENVVYPDETFN